MIKRIVVMCCLLILLFLGCPGSFSKIDLEPEEDFGITIVNLFDRRSIRKDLYYGEGLSLYVTVGETSFLFDTGNLDKTGLVILDNMEALAIEPEGVENIVISHHHQGIGLTGIKERAVDAEVFIPMFYYTAPLDKLGIDYTQIPENAFIEMMPHVFSTGSMYSEEDFLFEQAVVIEYEKGIIVLTGCAHPGLEQIIARIKNRFDQKPIKLLITGNIMEDAGRAEIREMITFLEQSEIEWFAPGHCSGQLMQRMVARAIGRSYVNFMAGTLIQF